MSRAYLCVSVATVSDRGRGGERRRPPSFEGVTDGVVRRIHPFFERFGAKPTYLLSPDVLRDPRCLETFGRLATCSELGTHLDQAAANERDALTEVTDLFIRAFGHQPQSFRGDAGGRESAPIAILESLGYAVDSSVTPCLGRSVEAPTQPYRPDPDPEDAGRPGDSTVLEVPATIRRRTLSALPGLGGRLGPRWLRPTRGPTNALLRVAEDELAAARRAAPTLPVILNAVLENVDVVPAASPHGANEEAARGILDGLRALLAFARRLDMPVVGLSDVPEILRQ